LADGISVLICIPPDGLNGFGASETAPGVENPPKGLSATDVVFAEAFAVTGLLDALDVVAGCVCIRAVVAAL
jgi:hypothetical protein